MFTVSVLKVDESAGQDKERDLGAVRVFTDVNAAAAEMVHAMVSR
jgi:hypothetical protein